MAGNVDASVLGPILVHKYQKETELVGENGRCTKYEKGEELRTLPECMYSGNVPCIDMWLYSHSTCPVCRLIRCRCQRQRQHRAKGVTWFRRSSPEHAGVSSEFRQQRPPSLTAVMIGH
ncbi:hypothetical protein HYC85_000364 [Camellia sinensis]|uniref:RING-type domain-containing protein n=1 Tax=Camellia sinensis TaxID=4442 RepID=A0A7J7I333_CAMSI|nr:hypothetical protein HYC85_000364 [Camellia sinensis]